MRPVFVEFTYINENNNKATGHTMFAQNPQHLDEILERYYLTPDKIKTARIDGDDIAAEYLSEYVKHIFKIQEEENNEL